MGTENKMSTHIDSTVVRLFLVVFLASAIFLSYRATRYTPCKDVNFAINSKKFVEGNLIKFIDKTSNAQSWQWSFGDSSKVVTSKEALHVFNKPGEYNVTLTVNGVCRESRKVVIKEKPFVIDSTKLAVFDLPKTIKVGETLTVVDKTANASEWEWRFGETSGANSKKKAANYVYETPGLKTVSLVVNGDLRHATSKKIEVLSIEKPEEKPRIREVVRTATRRKIKEVPTTKALGEEEKVVDDAPKTVPYINEAQFKNKLILVQKKKASPKSFKEYFCGELDKKIIVNGATTTFLAFCELLKDKKVRVKEVKLYRDKGSNCIKNITITRTKYIL